MSKEENDEPPPPGPAIPPAFIEIGEAVEQIDRPHAAHGGSTFSLYAGDLRGRPLYAVSLYPERGRVLDPSSADLRIILRLFIEANLDLLRDRRVGMGTWLNGDDGLIYLDIVATIAAREEAVRLAHTYNQIAIFDLAGDALIDTGGTGEPPVDLPPPGGRLPPS